MLSRGSCVARLLGAILCLGLLNGCSARYLWHVTVGQISLLTRQQPVEEVLHEGRLSSQEQHKLRLILDVRTFAITHLGLHESDSYTTFVHLDRPYVSYNLSASPPDALQPYVWRFPIVGSTPYKGFFDKAYALGEERTLQEQGYDTYLRGVAAYSTLGYFTDPILSSMLTASDFYLINTIIHEMLHQTVWIKGSVSFNESLANFVGEQGTLAYLAHRHGVDAAAYQQYCDLRADAAVFAAYMQELIQRLEALYQEPISRDEKLHRREQIFAEAIAGYPAVFPRLKSTHYQRFFEQRRLNNAVLLAFRVYHRDTAFFEQALAAHEGDLRRTIMYFKTLRPEQVPEKFRTR